MKRTIVYFFFLLFFVTCSSQPIDLLKDKRYINHWEGYENCCIQVIDTGSFRGVVLDGQKLTLNDGSFTLIVDKLLRKDSCDNFIIGFFSDSNGCAAQISTLSNNFFKSPLFRTSQNVHYFCQYVGITADNRKMLIISFQRDDSTSKSKRIQRKVFDLFKLIYTRIFFVKPFDTIGSIDEGFVLLYDIENDSIINLYY